MTAVWVLMSNNLCMGVFLTKEAAEIHAESILGGPERRQYEDWVGPWVLEDSDEHDEERRYVRDTDTEIPFALERVKVTR